MIPIAHPYYHALSSAKRFGGESDDYFHIHAWFDQTKAHLATSQHRLALHHDFGIDLCQQIYGTELRRRSDGVMVPVYRVARQHVEEDFGYVPELRFCLRTHPIACGVSAPIPSERLDPAVQLTTLVTKHGGVADDYSALVRWFGCVGDWMDDRQFFPLYGNSFGIFLAEAALGATMQLTVDGGHKPVPTRYIAETLILSTLGRIPSLVSFLRQIPLEPWMSRGARRLSDRFATAERAAPGAARTEAAYYARRSS